MIVSPRDALLIIEDSVQTHLRNETNVTKTMNAFIIYRNEFKYLHPNNNPSCKDVSKLASKLWKKEPEDVKSYYREIAKQVKERYKEIAPTHFFINNFSTINQVSTNDSSISLETSPLMGQNPLETTYSIPQNMIQSSSVTTYDNFPLFNVNDNSVHTNSQFMNKENSLDTAFPLDMDLEVQNNLPESLFSENTSDSDRLDYVSNPQIPNFDPSLFDVNQNSVNVNSSFLNATYSDPQHICSDLQFVNIDSPSEGQFSVSPTLFD